MRACNVARPWLKRAPCALKFPVAYTPFTVPHAARQESESLSPLASACGPAPRSNRCKKLCSRCHVFHTKRLSHIARSSCCHAFACASDVLWRSKGLGVCCAFPGLSFQACACTRDSRHVRCARSADPRVPARLALAGRSGAMPPADSFPSCPMASRAAWLGGCKRLADDYAAAKLRRRPSGSLGSRRCVREKSWGSSPPTSPNWRVAIWLFRRRDRVRRGIRAASLGQSGGGSARGYLRRARRARAVRRMLARPGKSIF